MNPRGEHDYHLPTGEKSGTNATTSVRLPGAKKNRAQKPKVYQGGAKMCEFRTLRGGASNGEWGGYSPAKEGNSRNAFARRVGASGKKEEEGAPGAPVNLTHGEEGIARRSADLPDLINESIRVWA